MFDQQASLPIGSHQDRFLYRVLRRFAFVGLIYGLVGLIQFGWMLNPSGFSRVRTLWQGGSGLREAVQAGQVFLWATVVLLPIGSWGLLRLRWWGRIGLLIWAIATVMRIATEVALMVLDSLKRVWDVTNLLSYSYQLLQEFFPLMFLWAMFQREVAELWARGMTRRPFEVLPFARLSTVPGHATVPEPSIAPIPAAGIAESQERLFPSRLTSWTGLLGIAYGIIGAMGILVLGFRWSIAQSIWRFNVMFAVEHVAWLAHLALVVGSVGMIRGKSWGRKTVIVWATWQIVAYVVVDASSFLMYPGSSASTHPSSDSTIAYFARCTVVFMDRAAFPVLALCTLLGRDRGRCQNCGYVLRATPERCPECGTIPKDAKGSAT